MNFKAFAEETLSTFFIIFFFAILGLVVYLHILGYEFVPLRDIIGVFISAVFTSLAGFVLYSKKELKRAKLIVRHFIHLILIMAISLSIATFIGWISWSVLSLVIRFTGLIFAIYISVMFFMFYQSKKLIDKMNKKLKERYRE